MKRFNHRLRGMTLIELLIASTIAAVVLSGLFVSLGNVYFSQKKVNATHSFASESRFLMERVAQLIRNNTIDYDRFFIEVRPDENECISFDEAQIPYSLRDTANTIDPPNLINFNNIRSNREAIGYSNLFYWNVSSEDDERYRDLGGKKPHAGGDDILDPCAQAWHDLDENSRLFLINKERTERVAIYRQETEEVGEEDYGRLKIERELGVDTTGNGIADLWETDFTWVGGKCKVTASTDPNLLFALDGFDEKTCTNTHEGINVSPKAIDVLRFSFIPGPDREPFLNYRVSEAQVQPHVFMQLETKLKTPTDFGLKADTDIRLMQQTTASSRVFGDMR